MSKTAIILLAAGAEETEFVTVADVLRRAGVELTIAGVNGLHVKGAHNIPLGAETTIEQCQQIFDAVVLPGGGPGADHLHASTAVGTLIRRHVAAGKIIGAICASPAVVLAPLGLLKGRQATCYPGFEHRLSPDATFRAEAVVVDGPFVTSRGPGTAMDFGLKLAELLVGETHARQVAHDMLIA